jgi:coproporphyrinogen III oxidase-like Fe-S oxidoreductase
MLTQEQEIQNILDKADWVIPLFEDEVPNTFPVPRIYSWNRLDKEVGGNVIKYFEERPPRSLYIGIPYCRQKCKYCVYRPKTQSLVPKKYIRCLENEFVRYRNAGVSFDSIHQIYVGGGTPSLLSVNQIQNLFRLLKKYCTGKIRSCCFELDPITCTEKKVNDLVNYGVNRFSIGVQCLDDAVLARQERSARSKHIKNALKILKKKEVYYNVDLIYGLQGQSLDSWISSLSQLVSDFSVPEFTLYRLRVGRQTTLASCDGNSSQDTRLLEKQMFAWAADYLMNNNYERVRPCHWVAKRFKKDWESYLFAPMSDQTADQEPQSASQIGIGGDAISHVNGLLVRNSDAENYIKKMSDDSGFAYESYYRMKDDDIAIRKILLFIEKNQKFPAKLLPKHTKKLQKHLDKLCEPNLMNQQPDASEEQKKKLCNPLLIKKPEKQEKNAEYRLTGNGLLFYDYIENLISYEIKKFDDRVAFSTPILMLKEKNWVKRVAEKIEGCWLSKNKEKELEVLELGAGVGALSIPVLKHLAEFDKQGKLNWTAYDNDLDNLLYYDRRLRKEYSISERENNGDNWSIELTEHTKVTLIHSNVESGLFCESDNNLRYDVIFMPSFLNHISCKMDCLRFAWESLEGNGLIVLGYPSGAWFGAEIGATWKYDRENDRSNDMNKRILKLWYAYFDIFPNFPMYFTRPIDDFGKALPGKMATIPPDTLRVPNIETFFHLLLNDGFSFLRSRRSNDDQSTSFEGLARLQTVARDSLRDIRPEHKSPFTYTWQFVLKKEEAK